MYNFMVEDGHCVRAAQCPEMALTKSCTLLVDVVKRIGQLFRTMEAGNG